MRRALRANFQRKPLVVLIAGGFIIAAIFRNIPLYASIFFYILQYSSICYATAQPVAPWRNIAEYS